MNLFHNSSYILLAHGRWFYLIFVKKSAQTCVRFRRLFSCTVFMPCLF
ncbi:hypothetical protein HMPREF9193_00982 [Treponema lecithinolyticum ATCC 700332]|uniref:Uncharacterized protein n=1 Tax=Treponema lecithinolyticum ATCC 700332 TaxID=1321815 RepID=A0ABN0NZ49_TRELE|nr:hypothetical protein HMPREF9193_00982 [Treponema lecithinolyticum ATCC 700332]